MPPTSLTLSPPLLERVLDGLKSPVLVLTETSPPPPPPPFGSVVLAVSDLVALRAVVRDLPDLGRARMVAVVVTGATAPLPLRIRPRWPALRDLDVRTDDDAAVTIARFSARVDVAEVLAGIAYADGSPGHGGLVVAPDYRPDDKVPPDVVTSYVATPESPVLGRAPVVVSVPGPGALDETLFNPIGFRRDWDRGLVDLDSSWTATPDLIASLRDAQGVRRGPDSDHRVATALAMSGVPLVSDDQEDFDDPMRREELSIRQRRAALAEHSTIAWRRRLGERAGVRVATYPSVSIVLATRRPDLLRFALRQVAKQRTPSGAELVLVGHGFDPDPAVVRRALGDLPHSILSRPADAVFGDVLRAATDAAEGDVVLKMDDDDWYGPDVVTDLLLARRYAKADLVGMPAEMVYLEPVRTTVRRRGPSENFGEVVAGGTMMIDRSLLREIGGFAPVPRHVDARLLEAVRGIGGSIYRTHGLGYLLRRSADGHTWDQKLSYFLTRRAVAAQWRGFRPSALIEHDESEAP